MRRVTSFLSLAVLAAACTRGSVTSPAPSEAAAPLTPSARGAGEDAPDASLPLPTPPSGEWAEAVRERRWADAARLLDALPKPEQDRSEVKYVRALTALELRDAARAAKLLDGLEQGLPVLADEIAEHRAEAQLEVGPFDAAAKYFVAQKSASALTKAATAWERAGKLAEARTIVDRALATAARAPHKKKDVPTRDEIAARQARARIAEKQQDPELAAQDLRWLATYAPTEDSASDVDARLEELAPKRALTARERYDRAMAMAREGKIELVERELGLVAKAQGPAPSKAELLHARGWAHYSARSYAKAADLLEEASKAGGESAASDLFHAARARSRAHQDERAIRMYGDVAKKFKKSPLAEQARFLSARLLYIMGRWREAADAYTSYVRSSKEGRFVETASYEQAVAWLAGGQDGKAAKVFGKLADVEQGELDRVLLRELEGVALAGAGKKAQAVKALSRVIEDKPLSFAALAAASRLAKLGAPSPSLIEPAKSGPVRSTLKLELPPKVKLLRALGLDADAESELEGQEESIRRSYAPRGDEALCQLYGQLSEASRRYRVGQHAARPDDLNRAPGADTRWLWECVYPRPYEELVRSAEKDWALPSGLVWAVMRQESGFSPSVVSPANAVGLMQLIPPTAQSAAKELNVTFEPLLLRSPGFNIKVGSFYLHKVLDTFGGNVALAAAAYNAGPSTVSRWLESGEGLPLDLFVARIPFDETRGYVSRVVGNLARYAYLTGGDEAVPKLDLEIPKGLRAGAEAY